MRTFLSVLAVWVAVAVIWHLIPSSPVGSDVERANAAFPGEKPTVAELAEPSSRNDAETDASGGQPGQAESAGAPVAAEREDEVSTPRTPRIVRVVSEVDGEPIEGVAIQVLGAVGESKKSYVSGENGVVKIPLSLNLRYRLTHPGFVPKSVSRIGAIEGQRIDIELRPFAQLFGKTEVPLPVRTPTSGRIGRYVSRDRDVGALGRIKLGVDERIPFVEGQESNFRGILDATRKMSDADREVQENGTWSLRLEIPPEIDALHDFVVVQERGNSSRTVSAVPEIRPGDSLEVTDLWVDVHPMNLRFVSADGRSLSPDLRFSFFRKTPLGFDERTSEVHLDENGRVQGVSLAAGEWSYASSSRYGHPELRIEGAFELRGPSEQTIVLPAGGRLTVAVMDGKTPGSRDYRIAVVAAGEFGGRAQRARSGDEVEFPFVPAVGAWEVVAYRVAGGYLSRSNSGVKELKRVPIRVDDPRIELVLD